MRIPPESCAFCGRGRRPATEEVCAHGFPSSCAPLLEPPNQLSEFRNTEKVRQVAKDRRHLGFALGRLRGRWAFSLHGTASQPLPAGRPRVRVVQVLGISNEELNKIR
ncbi:uncharacterized protein LOC144576800 [Callithrix jacchus]